jgi:hypothetical protein
LILIIKERATLKQVEEMLQTLEVYIKIAVDVEKGILAGGGQQHAECEAALLKDGSKQKDIWGVDWIPFTQKMAYESIINIRPSQNNRGGDNSRSWNTRTCDANYSKINRWL